MPRNIAKLFPGNNNQWLMLFPPAKSTIMETSQGEHCRKLFFLLFGLKQTATKVINFYRSGAPIAT